MSDWSYFWRRSGIWLLKFSVLWLLVCGYYLFDNAIFCGPDFFTDSYCGIRLGRDLTKATIFFAISGFFLWVIWALFIFRFPPAPNTFTKNDARLAIIPNTPEGRFVCKPELRRMNGYIEKSKKFYIFRLGEQLPSHFKLIRVPENTIVQFKRCNMNELRADVKIDMENHGYNALIDCSISFYRVNYMNVTCVRGRPALVVSENYSGDINLLEERCSDNFDKMIYGEVLHNQDP